MPDLVAERIAAAGEKFAGGDVDGALIALVELWREVRAVEIAEAIDRVAGARPLDGKKLGPKTWMAMAARRDTRELDALLATPLPTGPKPLAAALEALYEWDDDPRIARVLMRLVEGQETRTEAERALQSRAIARLARLRDVRVLPALREVWVRSDVERSKRLTIATLEKHAVALSPEALAALAAFTNNDGSERALLAAIAAAPDDRAAYEVYGDWLAERADPRGELLALQLGESKDARRIAALIAHHGERWAGEIGKKFERESWRFERGLFAGGELVSGIQIETPLVDPAWAFVRVIRTSVANVLVQQVAARVVAAAPAVREFGIVSPAITASLASASLRELAISNPDEQPLRGNWFEAVGRDAPQTDVDPRIAELPGLPALDRLAIYSRVTPAFASSAPVLARLSSLVLRRAERETLAALAARTDTPKLRSVTVDLLSNLTLTRDGDRGPFTHATAQLTDARDIERIGLALERVPNGWLRSLVVTGDIELRSYNDRELRIFETAVAKLSPRPTIQVSWQREENP